MTLIYGTLPVPYTASWSDEETSFFVGHCAFANGLAVCQDSARGQGKPQFGKPHCQRQREAVARGLCDLCGKPLKARTKVSLSHARPIIHAARVGDILQVEPLLHRECAATSMRHCPALKRDIETGSLKVRQVTRYGVQFAVMSPEYVHTIAGQYCKAIGHAKVQLLAWVDRDQAWLEEPKQ